MVIQEGLSPEIGPFYVIKDVIYGDTEDIIVVRSRHSSDILDSDQSHYDYWSLLRRVYPELRKVSYDYFPRGRIVYNINKDQYIIYFDKCLDTDKYKDMIIDEFNLPRNKTIFDYDEHYQCHSCNKEFINIIENIE